MNASTTQQPPKYATIHSRWLEGACEKWVGEKLPHDECFMTPQYIKQILGTPINMPIVLIGDGQREEVKKNLQEDADIGPHLIVAADLPVDENAPQPFNDMVIATNSEIFIGTRVSSMAVNIAQARVALGADPKSNYVYTWRRNSTEEGAESSTIEVCSDCLWLCNITQSDVCGGQVMYA